MPCARGLFGWRGRGGLRPGRRFGHGLFQAVIGRIIGTGYGAAIRVHRAGHPVPGIVAVCGPGMDRQGKQQEEEGKKRENSGQGTAKTQRLHRISQVTSKQSARAHVFAMTVLEFDQDQENGQLSIR